MTEIALTRVTDFAAVGAKWMDLEARSATSFFQSWTWTGCLAAERFPDPVLLEACAEGRTVALALFNRVRGPFGRTTLHLGESGSPVLDSPMIEHNGVLLEAGAGPSLRLACIERACRAPVLDACTTQAAAPTHRLGRFALAALRARRLVAGGIDDATLGALRGACRFAHVNRFGPAPYVDLARLRATGRDFLDGRSANTRQQLRRSDRAYAVDGPLTVTRAETLDQAMADLDALIPLHQATWTARGKAGAFANPFFTRFHRALIARALPLGQVDLLRVSAGNRLIGVLYNFRYRGHALAYQSGFAYEAGDHRRKPGLTSHHQAIRLSLAACLDRYDFLSGADRYKLSLSDGATPIYWAEDGWTPRLLGRWAHTLLSRCRRGAETDAPNRHRRDPSLVP